MRCDNCFWATPWDVSGEVLIICERGYLSFDEAKVECSKSEPCEYHITHEEVDKICDKWNSIPN